MTDDTQELARDADAEPGRGGNMPQLDELRSMSPEELRASIPLIDELTERYGRRPRVASVLNAYRSVIEFDATGKVTPRCPNSAGAVMEMHELLGRLLRFDVAKALIRQYCQKWPEMNSLHITDWMIPDGAKAVSDFRDNGEAEMQVVPYPGATTTFVVFSGRRHGLGIKLGFFHHCWLAPNKVNAIYLRDFDETFYLGGIKSLGDSPEATAQRLNQVLASLGTKRVVCMGNSAGVFASWYYGILLPAHHVLNLSGPSSLELGLQRPGKARYYESLRDLYEQGLAKWPDIRALYEAHPEVKAEIFFANDHEFDRGQAEHMGGLPNVTLEPIYDYDQHFVLGELVRQGRFADILSRAAYPDGMPDLPEPVAPKA